MNTPPVPAAATPSGWADARLSQAYELVAAVQKDWVMLKSTRIGEGIYGQLNEALDAIELGDGLIVIAANGDA